MREKIAGIVRTREAWWGGDLHPVIEKLAKASNVAIDWMGWRICGKVLTTTEQVEGELIDTLATKWVIEHLFGNEKDPWTWRVYGHILCHSKENDYRIVAVQRLGADGPTSAERPLPADVAEVWKLLDSLADQDEDLDLRREAKAALARLVERAHDEAARETRISICQIASRSTVALLPGEWIVHSVEPPRLLISLNLTTFPRPEETSFVARMDASQGGFSRSHRGSVSRSRLFVTPVHDERRGRWLLPAAIRGHRDRNSCRSARPRERVLHDHRSGRSKRTYAARSRAGR